MSVQQREVILSRFFDSNVQLVAKMCPRCYEECVDVKIIGVNLSFLKQTSNNFEDIDPKIIHLLTETQSCTNNSEVEDVFLGFNDEEIGTSKKVCKSFSDTVEEFVKKEVKRNNTNNNIERGFIGFSTDEINNSKNEYQKIVEVNKLVRHKIYKKLSLKTIQNICSKKIRNQHRKTNRRKLTQCREEKSGYFKYESGIQKNRSKYFSTNLIKEETIDLKVEDCKHVKADPDTELEMVDYEADYFNARNRNEFKVKSEDSLLKKEGFEDYVPEEKPTIWIPPRSPHNLIEEVLYHDPWALLVATIFLNRTSCMCARPYVFWFLAEHPHPLKVLEKLPQDLEKYFIKLGLHRTRALQVWRMSHDFMHEDWTNVKELYGIGEYGENAFRMFCQGDFSVAPKDRFLRIYKAWYEKIVLNGNCDIVEQKCFDDRAL